MSDETKPPPAAPLVPVPEPREATYEKCPHCGNVTLIEPDATLVYRCGICGKARVPVDRPGFKHQDSEVPALARASAAHNAARAWVAGSAFLGAFALVALLTLGLVISVLNPGLFVGGFSALVALVPAALAAYGVQRARQLRAQVAPALEEGWLAAAREVVEAEGAVDEASLAKMLKIPAERAEHLLIQLSALSPVRTRLGEGGELRFESPRVRVDEVADAKPSAKADAKAEAKVDDKTDDKTDDDKLAEEAAAEQEQAAPDKKAARREKER